MLEKPNLEERHRLAFEKRFAELVKMAPEEVQKEWDGTITWDEARVAPRIGENVLFKMKGTLRNEYNVLLYLLLNRTIE